MRVSCLATSRVGAVVLALLVLSYAAGCTAGHTDRPGPRYPHDDDGTHLVLAVPGSPADLNPLDGFAPYGAAKIYNGLLAHQPDGSLRPMLAVRQPVPSADGRSWTVRLRRDVAFSDGTSFDAADVVATYRTLLDPASRSPLRGRYAMVSGVDKTGPRTVRFHLAHPYPAFPGLLVLGILPSQALVHGGPVARMPISDAPVGTGPYRVVRWQRGEKLVLRARKTYFLGAPAITHVTVLLGQGDAVRAKELREGTVDGAALPSVMAGRIKVPGSYRRITQRSAEFRAITLPAHDPVTGDPAMRKALNYAVDRRSMVHGPLAGAGSVASTPVTDAQPEYREPSATFDHDERRARKSLRQAGWLIGDEGIRSREGTRARITLDYPDGDSVAHDLAEAFAADAKAVGVRVTPEAVPPTRLGVHADSHAVLISSGNPFNPDLTVYPLLHTGGAANRTSYSNAAVDTALDAARAATNQGRRAVAYRQMQRAYVEDPAMVVLVRQDHTYFQRTRWTGYQPVIDAAARGFTWGAWWNLAQWSPT